MSFQLLNILEVLPKAIRKRKEEKYTDWLAKDKISLFADVTIIYIELKEDSKFAG